MAWAFWRRQRGLENAVRLRVALDVASGQVIAAELTPAKTCERKQWRECAQRGTCDLADRYYSQDCRQLRELQAAGRDFVVRLRLDAQWVEENCELLTAADRAANVSWASTVRLGNAGEGPRVRVVAILGEKETILVATSLPVADFAPEMVAISYRHRWQGELAEVHPRLPQVAGRKRSGRGGAGVSGAHRRATAVLYRGERPNRRQMEAIQSI